MTGQFFISLLNPGLGFILAGAFLILWLNLRDQSYVLFASGSYAASALGFLVQDVGPALPGEVQRLPANLCFLAAAYLLAVSVLGRYRIEAPHRALATIAAAGAAGLCWYLFVDPSITPRIYSISFALGLISLLITFRLWRLERPRFIDRVLFWMTLVTGAGFILRPIAIFALIGEVETYTSPQQAFYWSTVQFSQAMVSTIFALSLLVAVATDLIAELRHQAHTDKLSGLLNRRGFEESAEALLSLCAERGRPVALLIADIDHFKRVNDDWGHGTGDRVIEMFGAMLAGVTEPGVVVGRIGGEEFAVLMADAEPGVARLFAERIRAEIGVRAAESLPDGLRPTVSVGLHVGRGDLYALLARADLALYEAKRSGRDRVCVYRPEFDAASARKRRRDGSGTVGAAR